MIITPIINSTVVDAHIAILDSGIDLDHDYLNVFNEKSFIPGTMNANDDHDHGTHLAGVAALYKSLHPEASPNDVKSYLMTSGTNLTDLCYGNSQSYFVGDRDEFPGPFIIFRYKIRI
jgi:subtilisin family serine protease